MDTEELRKDTLQEIPDDKAFWMCTGVKVTNIHDLADAIESLSDEAFGHHVNDEGKNDFAVWIHDVLHNPGLARDLDLPVNLNSKTHYVKTIRDHVAWLESV